MNHNDQSNHVATRTSAYQNRILYLQEHKALFRIPNEYIGRTSMDQLSVVELATIMDHRRLVHGN